MTTAKPKVGDIVKAEKVTRPDGTEHVVTDGLYVLDAPGTFLIDGAEVVVK